MITEYSVACRFERVHTHIHVDCDPGRPRVVVEIMFDHIGPSRRIGAYMEDYINVRVPEFSRHMIKDASSWLDDYTATVNNTLGGGPVPAYIKGEVVRN